MKFALLGDPVSQSKSPAMHEAAYRKLGMSHSYEAMRASREEISSYINRLRSGEFHGFNVTVPHKENVLAHVDEVHESARAVSAANTLVRTPDGKIIAHNTDVPALADEIRALSPTMEFETSVAIVLGSGGAARAAVFALAHHLRVHAIVVRGRAFAKDAACTQFNEKMAENLRYSQLVTVALASPAHPLERGASIVVQATSAGMRGADSGDDVANAISWDALAANSVALDVVYAPPRTPFLHAAAHAGLRHTHGIGMLARQGARAFELWLGVPAPYDVMLDAIS